MILVFWYLSIIFFVLTKYVILYKKVNLDNFIFKEKNIFLSSIALFFFITFLFDNLSDTFYYYQTYLVSIYKSGDVLFDFLQGYMKSFGNNFLTFFLLKKIFLITFILFFFKDKRLYLPIFLFSPFVLLATENGLRQGGALLLFFIFISTIDKRIFFALFLLILSIITHKSIILLSVIYFLYILPKFILKDFNEYKASIIYLFSLSILFLISILIISQTTGLFSSYLRISANDFFEGSSRTTPLIKHLIFSIYFLIIIFLEYKDKVSLHLNPLFFIKNILGFLIIIFYFLFDYSELSSRLLFYYIGIEIFIFSYSINHPKFLNFNLIILTFYLFTPNVYTQLLMQL
jgi:hypothetical protein